VGRPPVGRLFRRTVRDVQAIRMKNDPACAYAAGVVPQGHLPRCGNGANYVLHASGLDAICCPVNGSMSGFGCVRRSHGRQTPIEYLPKAIER
jgi:hypothetical protein